MTDDPARLSVLVVEDDDALRGAVKRHLITLGCEVRTVSSLADAREELSRAAADIALVDYQLPDGTGDQIIRWALDTGRVRAACCMTARATCHNVVEAMRAGSFDVLEKPFHLEQLGALIRSRRFTPAEDLHAWRLAVAPDIIGDDPGLRDALTVVRNVADTDCSVVIYGESGTGKELIARALHAASPRRDRPLVAINCAAIPESLIEAELFGHTRGAFTGAVGAREGVFAAADGGTLFLDEVGDMPLAAQAKLLRVLQERHVTPLGSDRAIPIDVRVVAATHRDLEQMVDEGRFRADLFFRLSVIRVESPALRERPADVLPLARYFLDRANRKTGRTATGFDDGAEKALVRHGWPGNVRELCNTVERAVLLRGHGRIVEADLQMARRHSRPMRPMTPPFTPVSPPAAGTPPPPAAPPRANDDGLNLREALSGVERQLIQQALERTGGNRAEAAALLGLNRTTLVEKMKKLVS